MKKTSWKVAGATLAVAMGLGVTAHAEDPIERSGPQVEPVEVAVADKKEAKKGELPDVKDGAFGGDRLMYTTQFYTANEAVIHGYEAGTNVRILDLTKGGTIWSGQVGEGETKLIPTGQGVFSFVSDKKATILVGTPSRCAVVGYWVRDETGSYRSDRMFTQLPSNVSSRTERAIVWAWADTKVKITNTTTKAVLYDGKLKSGQFYEIGADKLAGMGNHVLKIEGDQKALSTQVYYDEGYFVPSEDGRASGKLFRSYVGTITNSVNDLQLFAYGVDTKVKVTDLKAEKTLWEGTVKADTVHTMTLADKYVEITSDYEISAAVSPYEHYKANYAEHHFAAGQEGTGIDGNVLLTTPGELWVFSYYDKNPVIVTNMKSGEKVWEGTVDSGKPINVNPGHGFYRVRSAKGVSAMGGASSCGAEFSPAGGLFAVDEALLKAVQKVKAQRIERAKKAGKKISDKELNAPLNAAETKAVQSTVNEALDADYSADEIQQRSSKMKTY
jgi:hypothetical protein